jgi:hypothetical protein
MAEPLRAYDPEYPDDDRRDRADARLSEMIDYLSPMQRAVDLRDLWAALADAVVKTMRADACLISTFDSKKGVLRDVAASVEPPARLNRIVEEYVLDEFPATKSVLETGRFVEVSVNDPAADPAERAILENLSFSRLMICRLDVGDERFGTVEIYRVMDRPFRQGDDRQVATLCEFATNAYKRIQLTESLENHYTETLTALASALEAKDPYTQEHTSRIRELALALGEAMRVSTDTRRALALGAILHDVGKIGIADSVLLKPGPLTDEEWVTMRQHPLIGEHMLKNIGFVRAALPIIRHHHERWDGAGYPDRLKGEEIPIGARIVAICDAFDAMTTDRPYRKAMSFQAACDELVANAGTQFDPTCVALAVQVIHRLGQENVDQHFVRYANA